MHRILVPGSRIRVHAAWLFALLRPGFAKRAEIKLFPAAFSIYREYMGNSWYTLPYFHLGQAGRYCRHRRLPAACPQRDNPVEPTAGARPSASPLRAKKATAPLPPGVCEGRTLGTPIGIYVPNGDQRPLSPEMKDKFRPSHADFTYQSKFGIRNHEGVRASRETIGRVAAGAIARKVPQLAGGIELRATSLVHDIEARIEHFPSLEQVEANLVRRPDPAATAWPTVSARCAPPATP